MIKIGDRVKFLNDPGGGIVEKIEGDQAFVLIEEGFVIPTLISNLIKDSNQAKYELNHTNDENFIATTEKPQINSKSDFEETKLEFEVSSFAEIFKPLLAFVIESELPNTEERKIKIYLINEGQYFIYYTFSFEILNKRIYIADGKLEPNIMAYIGQYSILQLHVNKGLSIDILPYNLKSYKAIESINVTLEWDFLNLTLSQQYKPNEYFEQKAHIINLYEHYIIEKKKHELFQLKDKIILTDKQPKKEKTDIEEVDLHIDKIISAEQVDKMTRGQILEVQLDRFNYALQNAIKSGTKKIVFIHGAGNGKLRYEIQKILNRNYPHLRYQDASFAEYGYGATMIFIKK